MKKIGIIGGGASGMMAAIAAAGCQAQVTILEKQARIGKKLLATGNGKCNLSNLSFCVDRDYHSKDLERLPAFFSRFGVQETIGFFEDCGMLVTEKNGYLYPRSGQAATVLSTLTEQLVRYQVRLVCDCRIERISPVKKGFLVHTSQEDFIFDELILACGSPAGTKEKEGLGGTAFAKALGLSVQKMLPSLVQLYCRGDFLKLWAGVRCDGAVKLVIRENGKNRTYSERGELQLTDYGISGIPVFQCSRFAALALEEGSKVEAVLDFMPEYNREEWQRIWQDNLRRAKHKNVSSFLEGMLHKKIVQVLLKQAGLKPDKPVSTVSARQLETVFCLIRSFPLAVTGVNPPEKAQVCLGGVLLREVDDRLQAKKIPHLYLAGELLDVDGRCGGYNLQWAWTSGYLAGRAAAGKPLPDKKEFVPLQRHKAQQEQSAVYAAD